MRADSGPRQDEEGDRRVLTAGCNDRQHVEELVVTEDIRHGVGPTAYSGQAPWRGPGTPLAEEDLSDRPRACANVGLGRGV